MYYILEGLGAAVSPVHCISGALQTQGQSFLHFEPLQSLLGLGCSSAKERKSQMLIVLIYIFFQRTMLVPRKRVGIEGQSIICGLKTKENQPIVQEYLFCYFPYVGPFWIGDSFPSHYTDLDPPNSQTEMGF